MAHVRAESFEGIFALSKAEAPKGFEGEALGSFDWWNDFSSEQLFLYGRLINSPEDVHDALINLERDLGVDSSDMIAELSTVGRESNEANRPMDPAGWEPATFALSLEIMGFDPAEFIEAGNKLNDPLTPECIAAKNVASYEASLKSMPSMLKSILIAAQSSCGGGGGPTPKNCPGDIDCDGINDADDFDMDGDGIPNITDPDVDGDGDPNSSDPDIDGDGIPNESDSDVDGDTINNEGDADIDGDGSYNDNDNDADGDGTPNPDDSDADGDGTPNPNDPSPNGCTTDCWGACCNTSTAFCSVQAKSACSNTLDFFAGTDKICNPNPCCIQTGNPTFLPTDAHIMRKFIPIPPNNPNWGETGTEDINITTSFACDGTQWCAVVDDIEGIFTEWYRLLPGVVEVTGPPPGNTTEQNHCLQVFDLNEPNADNWFM